MSTSATDREFSEENRCMSISGQQLLVEHPKESEQPLNPAENPFRPDIPFKDDKKS